jgi:hypothetical protein
MSLLCVTLLSPCFSQASLYVAKSPNNGRDDSIETISEKHFLRGSRGPRGHRGHRGKRGKHGDKGHHGHEGRQGPRGPQGENGLPGPTGPSGVEGPLGPPGAKGATGLDGALGATGPLPTDTFILEEFVSGATGGVGFLLANIGALGWDYRSSVFEEEMVVTYQPSEQGHPGIVRLYAPVGNEQYDLLLNQSNEEIPSQPVFPDDSFDMTFILRVNNANLSKIRVGLTDYPPGTSNGIWFEGAPEGNWIGVTAQSDVRTDTPLLAQFLSGAQEWDTFRILNDANGVTFTITTSDGTVTSLPVSGNIPYGVALVPFVEIDTTGITPPSPNAPIDVDYMSIQFPNLDRTGP